MSPWLLAKCLSQENKKNAKLKMHFKNTWNDCLIMTQ